MARRGWIVGTGPISLQCGVAALASLLIGFTPPAQGNMLLVPLGPAAGRQMAALAVGNGARLVQAGPLPSSLIVSGDRSRLLAPLGGHGVLVLGARGGGCGRAPA